MEKIDDATSAHHRFTTGAQCSGGSALMKVTNAIEFAAADFF